ncbi:MAG: AbrB/MazE/SpoVT family DNA-binding domain-containing protein [Oscillospiraceae bacterium]|nr:AbrB/MazE/SpoVT family DNA-binding domain-containing protein [Oscillospiraceae bacterium]
MKATGITRRIDELGRIVLPIELRRTLGISERDSLEIFVEDGRVVLQKYEPACTFCGNSGNMIDHMDKNVCGACVSFLKSQ